MVHEFSFLDVTTAHDWKQWAGSNVEVDAAGEVRLARAVDLVTDDCGFEAVDLDTSPSGNAHVLDASGTVSVYLSDAERRTPLSLYGVKKAALESPTHIGVTSHSLVVLDANGGVAGFSRRRRELEWTTTCVSPLEVVGSETRVFVLSGDPPTATVSESSNGTVETIEHGGSVRTILEGLSSPRDLAVAPDETLYVLDQRGGEVVVLQLEENADQFASEPTRLDVSLPAGFVPERVTAPTADELVFSGSTSAGGHQLLRCELDGGRQTGHVVDRRYQRLSSGPTETEDITDGLYLQDTDGRLATVRKAYRHRTHAGRYEGTIVGRFDSGVPGMEWHRMRWDTEDVQPGSRIEVTYYGTDGETEELSRLEGVPDEQRQALNNAGIDGLWDLIEQSPEEISQRVDSVSRSDVTAFQEAARDTLIAAFDDRSEASTVTDPSDLLLEDADGRYLCVAVRLIGTAEETPRVCGIRSYCPRQSYLRYLPELYQKQGSAFLTQYLSIFESIFVEIEEMTVSNTAYLDPQATPAEYLSWLSGWLSVDREESWPEPAKRELVARAPELYRKRGTRAGIVALLECYLTHVDLPDRTWEQTLVHLERDLERAVREGRLSSTEAVKRFRQYYDWPGGTRPDDIALLEYTDFDQIPNRADKEAYLRQIGHPRRIVVTLHPDVPAKHVERINTIVENATPAHVDVATKRLEKRVHVGTHSYLGTNTILEHREFDLGTAVLGHQTIL